MTSNPPPAAGAASPDEMDALAAGILQAFARDHSAMEARGGDAAVRTWLQAEATERITRLFPEDGAAVDELAAADAPTLVRLVQHLRLVDMAGLQPILPAAEALGHGA